MVHPRHWARMIVADASVNVALMRIAYCLHHKEEM